MEQIWTIRVEEEQERERLWEELLIFKLRSELDRLGGKRERMRKERKERNKKRKRETEMRERERERERESLKGKEWER